MKFNRGDASGQSVEMLTYVDLVLISVPNPNFCLIFT